MGGLLALHRRLNTRKMNYTLGLGHFFFKHRVTEAQRGHREEGGGGGVGGWAGETEMGEEEGEEENESTEC